MREIHPVHSLALDGYGNNPLPDPLVGRAEQLRQQGTPVTERFTLDASGTLWHWIEYREEGAQYTQDTA